MVQVLIQVAELYGSIKSARTSTPKSFSISVATPGFTSFAL